MSLDVRSAVVAAQKHFASLEDLMGFQIQDLMLEETEISEDKKYWFITLGFTRPVDRTKDSFVDLIAKSPDERDYKVFQINAETGEVQSMKIREL
ncbi:MAG: hypothetical protein EBE86_006085 [Hormoscilla sp. GUM202]|nr:hypothetical protein [Hormoscilla sp. GUM202]